MKGWILFLDVSHCEQSRALMGQGMNEALVGVWGYLALTHCLVKSQCNLTFLGQIQLHDNMPRKQTSAMTLAVQDRKRRDTTDHRKLPYILSGVTVSHFKVLTPSVPCPTTVPSFLYAPLLSLARSPRDSPGIGTRRITLLSFLNQRHSTF